MKVLLAVVTELLNVPPDLVLSIVPLLFATVEETVEFTPDALTVWADPEAVVCAFVDTVMTLALDVVTIVDIVGPDAVAETIAVVVELLIVRAEANVDPVAPTLLVLALDDAVAVFVAATADV